MSIFELKTDKESNLDEKGTTLSDDVANDKKNEPVDTDKEPEKILVLDGPLSKHYTKELNKRLSLSKESLDLNVALFSTIINKQEEDENNDDEEDENEETSEQPKEKYYVYCDRSYKIDEFDVMSVLDEATGNYKEVSLALETERVVTESVSELDNYCSSKNMKIYYSKESFFNNILRV